jgi:hypothetical protein
MLNYLTDCTTFLVKGNKDNNFKYKIHIQTTTILYNVLSSSTIVKKFGSHPFPLFIRELYKLVKRIMTEDFNSQDHYSKTDNTFTHFSNKSSSRTALPTENAIIPYVSPSPQFLTELPKSINNRVNSPKSESTENTINIQCVSNIIYDDNVGTINPQFENTVKKVLDFILDKANVDKPNFLKLKNFTLIIKNQQLCHNEPYNLNICQVLNHIQNQYMGKGQSKTILTINLVNPIENNLHNSFTDALFNAFTDTLFNKILEKNTGNMNKLSRILNLRKLTPAQKQKLIDRGVRYRLKYKWGRNPFTTKYGGKRNRKTSLKTKRLYK